jgi:SAM-dependent methyltransferase
VTDLPDWALEGVDLSRPSAARVYDYFLGGSHNLQVDRELAEQIQRMTPNIGETMRANRAFLRRAVRFLVGEGIGQFLDIGSGIPTVGNVHEVAQALAPEARVVYVDVDPVAVAHSRVILRGNDHAAVVRGDLREPEDLLAEVRKLGLIDLEAPTAILLAGVVHFLRDDDRPAEAIGRLRRAVPPGSYLLISHVTYDGQPPEVVHAQRSSRTGTEIVLRSGAGIRGYFGDFQLVEPGLVFLNAWRPEPGEGDEHPERMGAYAGVGRKV